MQKVIFCQKAKKVLKSIKKQQLGMKKSLSFRVVLLVEELLAYNNLFFYLIENDEPGSTLKPVPRLTLPPA